MKKLTYTILLTCVFAFLLISCTEDQLPTLPTDSLVQQEVVAVSITSTSADLTLYVHSALPLSTPYNISIPGVFDEQFNIQSGSKKKWKLSNLRPGTYRVTFGYSESDTSTDYFFRLNFEIADRNGTQHLIPTQLGPRTYAFDLQVKN